VWPLYRLVELIVLNVGREAGVINQNLFTVMVMVALITTCMTTPMVHFIYPPSIRTFYREREDDEEEEEIGEGSIHSSGRQRAKMESFCLLMAVDRMEDIPSLTTLM